MNERSPKVIPFYGARDRRLFRIERESMDRDGALIAHLDSRLPEGSVLDVGAGDGFTARRLKTSSREVIPLEPSAGMIGDGRDLPFVRGLAQDLPFDANAFDAAYATWAYFFPSAGYGSAGIRELNRVVRDGGEILICDNAGSDAFCGLFERDISSDSEWWRRAGFEVEIVESTFRFATTAEASELLTYYWRLNGRTKGAAVSTEIEYRIAVYSTRV